MSGEFFIYGPIVRCAFDGRSCDLFQQLQILLEPIIAISFPSEESLSFDSHQPQFILLANPWPEPDKPGQPTSKRRLEHDRAQKGWSPSLSQRAKPFWISPLRLDDIHEFHRPRLPRKWYESNPPARPQILTTNKGLLGGPEDKKHPDCKHQTLIPRASADGRKDQQEHQKNRSHPPCWSRQKTTSQWFASVLVGHV